MAKKEKFCYECDVSFTVTGPKGYDTLYCPFCGNEVTENDDNVIEDEDTD